MRWDRLVTGIAFAAATAALLLAPVLPERRSSMSYYGYQDITESGYEPVSYNITQVTKQRRWPSPALVVPIAWAFVIALIVTLLVLF